MSWIDGFLEGFLALASKHHLPLAGGDLAESPLAVADIVLVGAVPRGKALLRSGARPGDLIYVTGLLGGAAAGLDQLQRRTSKTAVSGPLKKRSQAALAPHLWPQPRIAQGIFLRRKRVATAAIDISDGLSTDLDHLCAESDVCAEIDAGAIPLYPGANLEQALHGGEDYELLFTAQPSARIPRQIAAVPVTAIGRIVKKGRPRQSLITLVTATGRQPLERHGWEHFSR
jgi:thiamine-monophosphate kinase